MAHTELTLATAVLSAMKAALMRASSTYNDGAARATVGRSYPNRRECPVCPA